MGSKRLLFIPVSSPAGIGEYMRSLQLAQTLESDLTEGLEIHFILNQHTAYAEFCPFDTTLLNHSATQESDKVCRIIKDFKPDVVVFDCAGRAAQMKAAKKVGAKVIFISQHAKKRAKGLKLNRTNLIDKHWVVQPNYCIEPLSWFEKMKINLFALAYPENVGPYTAFATDQQKQQVLKKYGLIENNFFIVNAGSGGHVVSGENCADIYFQAARTIAQRTSLVGVVVFGPNYTHSIPKTDELVCIPSQKGIEFLALLSQAKLAVLSGGDTLLQAVAVKTPAIACAISKDQSNRIMRCVVTGVITQAALSTRDISSKAIELMDENNYQTAIKQYDLFENTHSFETITQGVKTLLLETES
jgi:spore coat polysaccharide biosynthesis predicted glycosyltransferase SpsG